MVGLQIDNLSRAEVTHTMIVEIGETGRLARNGIRALLLSYHDWRTAEEVTCSNDTVLCEKKHSTRTFYLTEDILYAVNEILSLND